MQNIVSNAIVYNDLKIVFNNNLDYLKSLSGKSVLVTGATGLIGSFFVRSLMYANMQANLDIKILAMARNKKKAEECFTYESFRKGLKIIVQDVNKPIKCKDKVDYIIHCASNTASKSFVDNPVETLDVAVKGTKNILEFAKAKNIKSMVYLSSMEVYGELDAQRGLTKESDLGYVDILKPRSSYQVGKRVAEAYCSYYAKEYDVPVKIARLSQIISGSAQYDDARVFAYFARCVVEGKDIVLNTPGDVIRSFCYITDAVSALLKIIERGKNGETYNVANEEAIIKIKDLAQNISEKYPTTNLKFDLKDGGIYPKTTNWKLDTSKLKDLGWTANVNLYCMISYLVSSFNFLLIEEQEIAKKKIKKWKLFFKWLITLKNLGSMKCLVLFGNVIPLIRRDEIYRKLYWHRSLKKTIVFNNFDGNGYGCNPKYISEEILKRKLPYNIVWVCSDERKVNKNIIPKNIKIVSFEKDALNALATAKIIVSNVRMNKLIKRGWQKKPNQFYLQTWHGSLGIKKLDASVLEFNKKANEAWVYTSHYDSNSIDNLLVNSTFEKNVFKESFWYNGEFKEFGHPRNDIFFEAPEIQAEIKNKVRDAFGILGNKKIITYAPTFRDDKRLDVFALDANNVIQSAEKYFNEECCLLIRFHPKLANFSARLYKFDKNGVFDATAYPDIQELLLASDMFITDYSSCIFDYMLSRKPALIYAKDIDFYKNYRGFYYPIESTPFPIAQNNDELAQNILNFDYDKYKNDVEVFLNEKGCIEDGHASERVVDLIEEIMGK